MLRLMWSDLTSEPLRLAVTVAGVAGALVLVLALGGLFEGTSEKIVTYPQRSGADVWVMQEGVSNMHMATSILPQSYGEAISTVDGVEQATPILYVSGVVEAEGQRWFSYVIGIREGEPNGGPWDVAQGRAVPDPGGIVVPDVFARQAGFGLGDRLTILGASFRVDGITRGTYSMANSLTFVPFEDMARLLSAGPTVSYYLVKAGDGVDPQGLATRLESAVAGTNAMTTEDFVASDRVMARQMGADIIQVMTLIGFVIGVGVVGLTMYGATVSHAREYGVVKALGATNRRLIGVVVLQAVAMIALGFGFAIGLALLLRQALPLMASDLAVSYPGALIGRVAVAAGVMAVVSSVLPAWRIPRLEPVIVFKE
ncbi:MAG: ABC transporter permease [Chloroflexi bacterium]|nr:ABC transporter permease [Chloroflexota bacterium]